MSCRSQAKKAKHDRGESENGPLGNAHVFDTIANAFDDARKEISDGLHGENLLGLICPKIPEGTGGRKYSCRNGRSRAGTQPENAEPRAKKAGKLQVPSIKNADFEQ